MRSGCPPYGAPPGPCKDCGESMFADLGGGHYIFWAQVTNDDFYYECVWRPAGSAYPGGHPIWRAEGNLTCVAGYWMFDIGYYTQEGVGDPVRECICSYRKEAHGPGDCPTGTYVRVPNGDCTAKDIVECPSITIYAGLPQ